MLAGACRFDGRVERQQIGLVGDARDRLDDVADIGGLLFQLSYHADRGSLALCGDAHIGDQGANLGAGLGGQGLRGFSAVAAELRVLQLAADGGFDLLEGRQGFLRRARCLLGAGGDLVHRTLEFFSGRSSFRNAG